MYDKKINLKDSTIFGGRASRTSSIETLSTNTTDAYDSITVTYDDQGGIISQDTLN